MAAGVVELHALADPVGPAAEDQHLALVRRLDLVLLVVGGVVVRRLCGELCRARVDGLEHRTDAECMAKTSYVVFSQISSYLGNLRVRKAVPFGPSQDVSVEVLRGF